MRSTQAAPDSDTPRVLSLKQRASIGNVRLVARLQIHAGGHQEPLTTTPDVAAYRKLQTDKNSREWTFIGKSPSGDHTGECAGQQSAAWHTVANSNVDGCFEGRNEAKSNRGINHSSLSEKITLR